MFYHRYVGNAANAWLVTKLERFLSVLQVSDFRVYGELTIRRRELVKC